MSLIATGNLLSNVPSQQPFKEWRLPDGQLWIQFYRTDEGYLLLFPDLASFAVSADGMTAQASPFSGVNEATIEHLYLNQVLPLMLSKQGRQVFHGSAVALRPGAVVFAGESGRGKSTLAASFATHGMGFLTDDGLVLQENKRGYLVEPSHPSVRLWGDSAKALAEIGARSAPPVTYTNKLRFLAGERLYYCDGPQALHRIYFLGNRKVDKTEFRKLRSSETMIELLKNSFLLDSKEQSRLSIHFNQIAKLAELPIHYRLDFPRCYEMMDEVRAAIIGHAEESNEFKNSSEQ